MQLRALDRKILNCLQQDLPLNPSPFKVISSRLKIKEKTLLARIKYLKAQGFIRNFSCRVNHKKLKFKSTLIGLRVPKDRLRPWVKKIISYPENTHCILRKGQYNLWSVFVYKDGKLNKFLRKMTQELGKENILSLPTERQFKLKTRIRL